MAANYYVILGVDTDATQDQIKSAYRRKAKQLHPDCCDGSSEPFLGVQEAYEVLSDPARRRVYDDRLHRERQSTPVRRRGEHLGTSRCPVEPLIPTAEPIDFGESEFDRFFRSPFQHVLDRWWTDLGSRAQPVTGRAGDIHVNIALTREQALHGSRARVWLPVRGTCPTCWGQGSVGFYECWQCAGRGFIVEEYPVHLDIPAGVFDNTTARVSLDRLGMDDVCLVVHLTVSGW